MTREEVKVVFTGVAHDHLTASDRIQTTQADAMRFDQYKMKNRNHNHQHHNHHINTHYSNQSHQHHHHHHQHHHHQTTAAHLTHNYRHHVQPLAGRMVENLPEQQQQGQQQKQGATPATTTTEQVLNDDANTALSTIAILRRHPMYDSLVLVKKYRPCLDGYTLEFPTSNPAEVATSEAPTGKPQQSTENDDGAHGGGSGCGRTRLVSVYLDGDDPIYQSQQNRQRQRNGATGQSEGGDGEMVYVPVNGLLDRLDNYDRQGIAIDSRVYAFAMGLKTAERFLTSSTVKEMQEAPPL